MERSSCPYLGIQPHNAVLELQLADRGFGQAPEFAFGIPGAAGGLDPVAQFGFAVGDAYGGLGYGLGRAVAGFDDQFDGGQALAGFLVFSVAYADEGIAVARGQALGAGGGGGELLEDAAAAGRAWGWRSVAHVCSPFRSVAPDDGREHNAGACAWQARWHRRRAG